MSPLTQEPITKAGWYEEICQQLDDLRDNAKKFKDPGEIIPSDKDFELVKQTFSDIRRLADFPSLPQPDIWLGPEGEIGLSWESGEVSLDIVFACTVSARFTKGEHQELIETKDVPAALSRFAA